MGDSIMILVHDLRRGWRWFRLVARMPRASGFVLPTAIGLAVVLLLPTSQAEIAQALRATEAASHVGEQAVICGLVASVKYAVSTPGAPTFLNLDRPYPDHIFTILIWGTNRPAFGKPEERFAGKRICASGRIVMYKGRAEIVAKAPSQVWIDESK